MSRPLTFNLPLKLFQMSINVTLSTQNATNGMTVQITQTEKFTYLHAVYRIGGLSVSDIVSSTIQYVVCT